MVKALYGSMAFYEENLSNEIDFLFGYSNPKNPKNGQRVFKTKYCIANRNDLISFKIKNNK